MSIVSEGNVQQWLEATKLTIDDIDNEKELELTARNIVFGAVGQAYDSTTWIDQVSTPALIKDAMGMFIAAWIYNRAYAEDSTMVSSYSKWLEDKAYTLLAGISNGNIDIPEVPGTTSTSTPSFWPNDSSIDEHGYPEKPKFTMGSVF